MKQQLRTLFSPILNTFESGNEPFEYRASHRTILLVIGVLFSGLATLLFWLVLGKDPAYLFPVFVLGGGFCRLSGWRTWYRSSRGEDLEF
ncbi:hypothetical protein [Candidatus Reidiella endopervernicosa]|uniref:hypothetical protein n=1 Tax=Candidatus Reidiella endopervernicosa TaxID=2738883 RepID=UPI001F31DC0A|nr:hypothetical protein [Candidatus Reidiella endopervernicosa]